MHIYTNTYHIYWNLICNQLLSYILHNHDIMYCILSRGVGEGWNWGGVLVPLPLWHEDVFVESMNPFYYTSVTPPNRHQKDSTLGLLTFWCLPPWCDRGIRNGVVLIKVLCSAVGPGVNRVQRMTKAGMYWYSPGVFTSSCNIWMNICLWTKAYILVHIFF